MKIPRPSSRARFTALSIALATLSLLSIAGCDPRTLFYFLQGEDPSTPPPCRTNLKGKKVVIVSNASPSALGETPTLGRDISKGVAAILKEKISKIEIVPISKVSTWVEGHPSWTKHSELAEAFDAEYVIFFEIESFKVTDPSSPQMLHGDSRIHVVVTEWAHPKDDKGKPMKDQPKEENEVFDNYVEPSFPKTGPIPMDTANGRSKFLKGYIELVSTEVAYLFVNRPMGEDIQGNKF